jgi:hypothetical protein
MAMTTGEPEIPERIEPERSGLRVFLYVLLALGGLGVLTCAGLAFFLVGNPAVRELAGTIAGAQSAPGTQQLRDAGCNVAQVFDLGSAMAVLSEFSEEIAQYPEALDMTLVQCVVSKANSGGLGCDEVAGIYSSAVPEPPDRFLVQVTFQFSSQSPCQVVYGADGTPIAPLDQYDPEAMEGAEP